MWLKKKEDINSSANSIILFFAFTLCFHLQKVNIGIQNNQIPSFFFFSDDFLLGEIISECENNKP